VNYSAFVMPIDDDKFALVITLEGFANQPDAHDFLKDLMLPYENSDLAPPSSAAVH
tara:strand:+ start:414 stop:581 length:168 start_codon:yes stop_codon:yes gene_type:complete